MNILTALVAPFVAIGAMLGGLFVDEQNLGATETIPVTIAFFETTLQDAISSSATSFTLTSATDKDGTTLASSTYAFVIDEGSSNEEIVIADCTGTACTNALRGVSARTGNTEVASLKKAHRRGASIKITDAPILMLVSRILRGEQGVDFTPDANSDLVTKTYVDSLALGTTTVAATALDDGIVELATGTEAASSTATGNSGSPLTLHTAISTSTAPTTGSYVVVTEADGNIADGFIDSGMWALVASSTAIVNTYTASTTWTKPTGTYNYIMVELWGGGGSGAAIGDNDDASGAGGGGGGAYSKIVLPFASVSSSVAVTIGSGGLAKSVTAGNPSHGAAGGVTSFGSYLTAYGGGAGWYDTDLVSEVSGGGGGGAFSVGGNGGSGAAGTAGAPGSPLSTAGGLNTTAPLDAFIAAGGGSGHADGDDGGDAVYGGAGGGGCDNNTSAGNGGTSFMGGSGGTASSTGNGTSGSAKGGGGGAGCKLNAAVTSGAGGDGYARITTY